MVHLDQGGRGGIPSSQEIYVVTGSPLIQTHPLTMQLPFKEIKVGPSNATRLPRSRWRELLLPHPREDAISRGRTR